jgi:hypothetical protein
MPAPQVVANEELRMSEACTTGGQSFTAAAIARAIGCSKQNVHQRLNGIPADREQLAGGNLAKAWRIESLPAGLARQLSEKAELMRYRTVADLLRAPGDRYDPGVPLSGIAPVAIEKARKLCAALRPLIALRNNLTISAVEFSKRGVESYERVFGFTISPGHWRTLFDRTVERDNGSEEWERLEIYLEDNPPRIHSALSVSAARERGFEILEDALASLGGETELTVEQRRLLWSKTCDELQSQIVARVGLKRVKRDLVRILLATGLVGTSQQAIAKTLGRKWDLYQANDQKLPKDGRSVRFPDSNCSAIPEHDVRKLVARSLDRGGRVSQAWRELHGEGELSAETCQRFISNPKSKSRVPASVRKLITPQVKRLMPIHHGPREHQLRGAYNRRDYSNLFSGDSYQADDVTCPVYYWENDGTNGIRIIRGQLLLMIDERSRLALCFALHSEKNYNARIIRALITRVHDAYGLPRHRFYFERGIWKSSRILTGGDELSLNHTELGLLEFGVKFVHAKLPRGKVIERVIGLHQNAMDGLPGYVGRDEIHDRFERVQEHMRLCERGREDPSRYFLSKAEWESELARICEAYNSERQEGILNGLSPIEAWHRFQGSEPLVHLGTEARYLLAHHRLPMKIQRNGVTLRPSLGGGTYCGEITGRFVGERMWVWVNPEDLSSIALTSIDNKRGPFVVPKLEPLPAIDPSREQYARNAEQIEAHNGVGRTSYRLISQHLIRCNFRRLSVDKATVALGEKIAVGAEEARAQSKLIRTNARKIASRSRELGIQIPVQRTAKSINRTAHGADLIAESRRIRELEEDTK